MKFSLFNPTITKEAKKIMLISFFGLLTMCAITILLGYMVGDGFVARNTFSVIIVLLFSFFFIFRGFSNFRYFLGVFAMIQFVMFYILTLVPTDSYGNAIVEAEHAINQLDGGIKIAAYVIYNIIQILLITLVFRSKSVNFYMEQAKKERGSIIVKDR